ncbi:MAG: efflux RND transporter periplasmic adaptor subunit [Hyphomicrobiales bacterium]
MGGWESNSRLKALAISFLVVPLLFIAGCDQGEQSSKQQAAGQPLPAVTVSPVVAREVAAQVEFVGQANAFLTIDLRARVTGFLRERPFKEGGPVKKGELLFLIEPDEYESKVQTAEASITRSKATIEEAERDFERYSKLTAQGTTSEQKLEEAKATAERARADLKAAEADLTRQNLNLSYTRIESPIDGRIGRASVDVGNLIGPDSGVLATVVAPDPIRVVFSVSERDLLEYRKRRAAGGSTVAIPKLRLSNGEIFDQDGKIEFIDEQVDAATGTVQVRVEFPNPDNIILPGQFVTVVLTSGNPEKRVVVPQAAVQANQTGYFVMVVGEDDVVQPRPVKLGQLTGVDWAVEEGLTEGETIVVEGIQKIRPGAKVKPEVQTVSATEPPGSGPFDPAPEKEKTDEKPEENAKEKAEPTNSSESQN